MSEQDFRAGWIIEGPGLERLDSDPERRETLELMLSGLELQLKRAKIIPAKSADRPLETSFGELTEDRLLGEGDFRDFAEKIGRKNGFGSRLFYVLLRSRSHHPDLVVDTAGTHLSSGLKISLFQLHTHLPALEADMDYIRNLGPAGIDFMKQIVEFGLVETGVATE